MLGSANLGLWHFAKDWYDVITPPQVPAVSMKFGRPMQNNIPIMKIWSKSKQKVEFQYGIGGRYFFETESS